MTGEGKVNHTKKKGTGAKDIKGENGGKEKGNVF